MLSVGQLQLGMFVSKLDRPWLDTPFPIQGFYIRNKKDIDALKGYCNHVYIDVLQKTEAANESARFDERKAAIHKLPDQAEWQEVERNYLRSQELTQSILNEVRLRGILRQGSVRDTVSLCVDSILRSSHTLFLVSQLSTKGGRGLERHAISVCILAIAFGRYLGFDRAQLERLGAAAILHDIGMLELQEAILGRIYNGRDAMSENELCHIKDHPALGRDLLIANDWLMSAIDVAYCHHEHYDGSGYPRGLRGSAIPELARVVALADTYDAITNADSYQSNKSSLDALKIIHEQRGKQFDPTLAMNFIRFITIYPPGAIVELRNNLIGIVIDASEGQRHLPTIMVLLDENHKPVKPEIIKLDEAFREPDGEAFSIMRMYPPGSFNIDTRKYLDPS